MQHVQESVLLLTAAVCPQLSCGRFMYPPKCVRSLVSNRIPVITPLSALTPCQHGLVHNCTTRPWASREDGRSTRDERNHEGGDASADATAGRTSAIFAIKSTPLPYPESARYSGQAR